MTTSLRTFPAAERPLKLSLPAALVVLVGAAVVGVAVGFGGPRAAAYVAGGIGLGIVAVYAPGLIFGAYFVIAFYKAVVQPFVPVDLTLLLALLNGIQLVPVLASARSLRISKAGIVLWALLAMLLFAGVFYAPSPGLALTTATNWIALVFVPILAGALRVGSDRRYARQFLWFLLATSAAAVVAGLVGLSGTERLTLSGENTIATGRSAALVPLLAFTFVLQQRVPIATILTLLLIPAAIVVAVASGSRGPLLVLVILAVYWLVRSAARPHAELRRSLRKFAAVSVISAAVIVIVGTNLPEASLERFGLFENLLANGLAGEENTSVGDTSSGIRLQMFGLALTLFEDNPLVGIGTAGFADTSPRFLSPREAEAYPHNTLLQFASEFGLVGAALFVCLAILAAYRRLPSAPELSAFRALFAFFLFNAMISGDIYTDRQMWALLVLLLVVDVSRTIETLGPVRFTPLARRSMVGFPRPLR